jgi:CBS domain-containing protein
MKTVKQLLEHKGHTVRSIAPDATVFEAIKAMDKHGVGALVVLKDGKLRGILSERDYARKVILKGKSSKKIPVSSIMTKKVFYVTPEHTVDQCMALMTAKRIRHLPVLTGKKKDLTGIVSIGDVVRATIHEKDFIIEQLGKYISGTDGH